MLDFEVLDLQFLIHTKLLEKSQSLRKRSSHKLLLKRLSKSRRSVGGNMRGVDQVRGRFGSLTCLPARLATDNEKLLCCVTARKCQMYNDPTMYMCD